jgi:hypothetical protein
MPVVVIVKSPSLIAINIVFSAAMRAYGEAVVSELQEALARL